MIFNTKALNRNVKSEARQSVDYISRTHQSALTFNPCVKTFASGLNYDLEWQPINTVANDDPRSYINDNSIWV